MQNAEGYILDVVFAADMAALGVGALGGVTTGAINVVVGVVSVIVVAIVVDTIWGVSIGDFAVGCDIGGDFVIDVVCLGCCR